MRYADRLSRLILIMSLALYYAVNTGIWDAKNNPSPDEKNLLKKRLKKFKRSLLSFFKRGIRCIKTIIRHLIPIPSLSLLTQTDRW